MSLVQQTEPGRKMCAEAASDFMLDRQLETRRFGALASMTRRNQGAEFLGTTPIGHSAMGLASDGYQEQTLHT
eukprot:3561918-Rhodomonas_salina.1